MSGTLTFVCLAFVAFDPAAGTSAAAGEWRVGDAVADEAVPADFAAGGWEPFTEGVRAIRGVAVGPDGRVWRQVHDWRLAASDVAERRFAEQFAEASPLLDGVVPELFEPGGRVWMRLGDRRLLGYDGRTTVRYDLPADDRLQRNGLSRGQFSDGTFALAAGGADWFPS